MTPELKQKIIDLPDDVKAELIDSLEWLVTDAKYRSDDCRQNVDEGSQGGYSPDLIRAIALLEALRA